MSRADGRIAGSALALTAAMLLAACAAGRHDERAAVGSSSVRQGIDALDAVDRQEMERSRRYALEYIPSGRPASWRNERSGNAGTFVSRAAFINRDGEVCRPYTHRVTIKGRRTMLDGTACRDERGNWREAGRS